MVLLRASSVKLALVVIEAGIRREWFRVAGEGDEAGRRTSAVKPGTRFHFSRRQGTSRAQTVSTTLYRRRGGETKAAGCESIARPIDAESRR